MKSGYFSGAGPARHAGLALFEWVEGSVGQNVPGDFKAGPARPSFDFSAFVCPDRFSKMPFDVVVFKTNRHGV